MFKSEKFNFDGISSDVYGIQIVRTSSGLISSPFGVSRSVLKEQIPSNELPYFFGVQTEPLTFTLQLFVEGEWTTQKKRDIANWLWQPQYKPFYSEDNPDVIYNCIAVGNPEKYFTAMSEGYIQIDFECDSPYAWTPTYVQTYDCSVNPTTTIITFENKSNVNGYIHYPEIEFALMGTTTAVSLRNITDGGNTFEIAGLDVNETIYVNFRMKQIISSTGKYRYNNSNKKWLRVKEGINQIEVTGECIINTRNKYPVIA